MNLAHSLFSCSDGNCGGTGGLLIVTMPSIPSFPAPHVVNSPLPHNLILSHHHIPQGAIYHERKGRAVHRPVRALLQQPGAQLLVCLNESPPTEFFTQSLLPTSA